MPNQEPIEPSTEVATLLDQYPQLEDVLIAMAPPFKKLKNPLLRKSIAKVASLKQAAAVAQLPLQEMINTLRAEVGQAPIQIEDDGGLDSYLAEKPSWFDESNIVSRIDESKVPQDKMTLTAVLKEAAHMDPGQIIELQTTFLPAPGIDVMKNKGYLVWTRQENPDVFKTYFSKPQKTI